MSHEYKLKRHKQHNVLCNILSYNLNLSWQFFWLDGCSMMKDRSVQNSNKTPDVSDAFAVLNIMYTLFLNRFGIFVETQGRTSNGADETCGRLGWQKNLFTRLFIHTDPPHRQTDNDAPMTRNKTPWSLTDRWLTSRQIKAISTINTAEWQACHQGVTNSQLTMLIKTANRRTQRELALSPCSSYSQPDVPL